MGRGFEWSRGLREGLGVELSRVGGIEGSRDGGIGGSRGQGYRVEIEASRDRWGSRDREIEGWWDRGNRVIEGSRDGAMEEWSDGGMGG